MKLNVKAFGLACGIIWAAAAFFIGIWGGFYAPVATAVDFIGHFYIGYATGFVGAIIGAVWGFLDAGIGGAILAWLYNKLADKFAA